YEAMIGTVRQVGYKFVVPSSRQSLADRENALADQLLADLY
ncbi:DNA-binding response regulator, partial [Catellatospora sp. KI3]|nr:DNA-binding response regulator [Catellatospora sp. KI3]